jgi:hypothetical protein
MAGGVTTFANVVRGGQVATISSICISGLLGQAPDGESTFLPEAPDGLGDA